MKTLNLHPFIEPKQKQKNKNKNKKKQKKQKKNKTKKQTKNFNISININVIRALIINKTSNMDGQNIRGFAYEFFPQKASGRYLRLVKIIHRIFQTGRYLTLLQRHKM